MSNRIHSIATMILSIALLISLLMNLSLYQRAKDAREHNFNPLLIHDAAVLSPLSPMECDEFLYNLIRIETDQGADSLGNAVVDFYSKFGSMACPRIDSQYVVWQWLGELRDNLEWCRTYVGTDRTDLYCSALAREILARNGDRDSFLWLCARAELDEYAHIVQSVWRLHVQTALPPEEPPSVDPSLAEQLIFDAQLKKWRLP